MGTYEKPLIIPKDVGASTYRPGLFIFSIATKQIVLIELTVS